MSDFTISARSRSESGKGASRRLRRLSKEVPAVVYGGKKEPESIAILHKDLDYQTQNEAFFSQIISLEVDGKKQDVILKDMQRHPAKPIIMHADFLRINKSQKLHTKVPLHFINEDISIGVKTQGGSVSHTMTELEVSCLPADLPEYIEVDMANVEEGQILHISDLTLPEGVESFAMAHGHGDLPIAAIHINKRAASDEDENAVEDEADTTATDKE